MKALGTILLCAAMLLLSFTPMSAGDEEKLARLALLAKLSADINGDGTPDKVTFDRSGMNSLKAVDGKTGRVLWETTKYDDERWASVSRSGAILSPVLFDVDRDGMEDFILEADLGEKKRGLVALSHKTGAVLWTHKDALRPLKWYEGAKAEPSGRDFLLDGDLLLVADRPTAHDAKKGEPSMLVALDPHDGSVRWSAEMERRSVVEADERRRDGDAQAATPKGELDIFDASRKINGTHVMVRYQRPPPPSGGEPPTTTKWADGRETASSGTPPTVFPPLFGLSETARLLLDGARILYFGRDGLRAISRSDGKPLWRWSLDGVSEYQDASVLKTGDRYVAFARIDGDECFLASIVAADGALVWVTRLPLERNPRASGLLGKLGVRNEEQRIGERYGALTIDLGEKLTLGHVDPDAPGGLRLITIDPATGKVESGLATPAPAAAESH